MNYFNNELIMQAIALIILLVALFLLYRIAYPKQLVGKKDNEVSPSTSKSLPDIIGKSHFVLPSQKQPFQTSATSQDSEPEAKKAIIFAAKNAQSCKKVIPMEQLDKVFSNEQNEVDSDEEFDIDIDDDDDEIDIDLEEAEELERALGQEAIYADGIDYSDLQSVAKVIKEQPEEVSQKTAKALIALEDTEMLEMLTAGKESLKNWIELVVARSIQKTMPETEADSSNHSDKTDYSDFVSDFLKVNN